MKLFKNGTSSKRITAADADPRARYRERRENARAKKAANKQNLVDKIKECEKDEDPLEALFSILVPASGPADTEAGELVRAMMRILYRDYNDGDVFYEGYGIETCADAVAYICDKIPKLENWFENIALRHFEEDTYTSAVKDIADEVVKYVFKNAEELAVTNKEDFQSYDGYKFVEDNEWIPTYELDLDLPDNVYGHLEEGDISRRDIEWEVEGWINSNTEFRVTVEGYYISIEGLSRDDYDEIEANGYRWLEDYGDELDEEYGDLEDEEDEDEEDEE